jgi:hypothetical protein
MSKIRELPGDGDPNPAPDVVLSGISSRARCDSETMTLKAVQDTGDMALLTAGGVVRIVVTFCIII